MEKMKHSILFALITLYFLSTKDGVVANQIVVPMYGGGMTPYSYNNNDDDDLGILLTILLLASRNRNCGCGGFPTCGCCNCCNCENSRKIPIPYPIPIPTNNPIIRTYEPDNYDDDETYEDNHEPEVSASGGGGGGGGSSDSDPKQVVNVITSGVKSSSTAKSSVDNSNIRKATSGSNSIGTNKKW